MNHLSWWKQRYTLGSGAGRLITEPSMVDAHENLAEKQQALIINPSEL